MRLLFWRKPKTPSQDLKWQLTAYQGEWVAVKDNKLVAHAPTASAMMDFIFKHDALTGCTIWFEYRPEDVLKWAVVYPSKPEYVCPNCMFSTREQAEAWVNAWRKPESEVGIVVTRDGQHDPWRSA